jgi:molecular chaperone GrpE
MTSEENKDMKDVSAAEADAEVNEDTVAEADPAEVPESEEQADQDMSAEDGDESREEEMSPEDAAMNELNKKYMRLAADFQNFKRRTEKEKSDIYQYANEKIALDVIEVIDNFERAIEHIEDCQDKQFAEGVEKIYKQLQGVLEKNSIEEIKAEGEAFDPNFHNAVMTKDDPEKESGIVISDMQKGYTLNGRVIRPSMVVVSR